MPKPAEPKQNRKRSWMRVSLRTFLVFLTLLCMSLGCWIVPSVRQRQAVLAIESMGGKVGYDFTLEGDTSFQGPPKWLFDWLGTDFFYSVKRVRVSHFPESFGNAPRPTLELNGLVSHLERLPKCRSLELDWVGLRAGEIAELAPLADQLESLSIRENNGDYGSGLVHIKDWPRLKSLELSCDTGFQSLDLTGISTCPKLEQLMLNRVACGWVPSSRRTRRSREHLLEESDFIEIAKCQQIKRLRLSNCSFEGNHLALLQNLNSLKSLSLRNSAPRFAPHAWKELFIGEKDVPNPTDSYDFDAVSPDYALKKGLPTDSYNVWQKRILPNVEFLESRGP